MNISTRRHFLGCGAAAGAILALPGRSLRAATASDQINLGFIGCGGRTMQLIPEFRKIRGVNLAGFCDPDQSRLGTAAKEFPRAVRTTDLRRLLDSPDIDAVVVAACNHWHALASIWAMEAGKHVYVEKPLGHRSWEGRQTVNAAKRYERICQVGTQHRSDPMQLPIKQFLHQDQAIGAVRRVCVNRFDLRTPIGKRERPLQVSDTVDYNLWLGPAADRPIYRDALQYDWHWDWNTGSGEMGNWGVHILDDVRNVVFRDRIDFPRRVISGGGRFAWNDAGDTPNLQFAILEAGDVPVFVGVCNIPAKPGAKAPPKTTGPSTGYVVYCEGGRLEGRRGGAVAFDAQGNEMRRFQGNSGGGHQQNFIDAIRRNDPGALTAPVETGHLSTEWCNLANAAFRAAGSAAAPAAPVEQVAGDWAEAATAIQQMRDVAVAYNADERERFVIGPTLEFDSISERFIGPHAEPSNQWLRRSDREGFVVPEVSAPISEDDASA